jgi:hypothetical protein
MGGVLVGGLDDKLLEERLKNTQTAYVQVQ